MSAGSGSSRTAIATVDLARVFVEGNNAIRALDRVTFDVTSGEVLGVLGPNGAGKTTLLKILTTVLLPSEGTATVAGYDIVRETAQVRRRIGIVFGGERGLYDRLTAVDNLMFWSALYGLQAREAEVRTRALLHRVGLEDHASRRVETFSRGMRQRLHLARGLLGDPPILFLDEPTAGMDPVATRAFRELVAELRGEGRTILLATHDLDEAAVLCDRVALIDHGSLLAMATPRELTELVAERVTIEAARPTGAMIERLAAIPGVARMYDMSPDLIAIELQEPSAASLVLSELLAAGITEITTRRPTLEEAYLQLVGDRRLAI